MTDTERLEMLKAGDTIRDLRAENERLREALRTLDKMIFDAPQTIEAAGEFRAFIWSTLEPSR